jgi:phospholipase C
MASINHVVVLMLENRSFDHMLGDLTQVYKNLDGIDPAKPRENIYNGKHYPQRGGAGRYVSPDPHHEIEHVWVQLQKDAAGNPSGFVQDFADAYPTLKDGSAASEAALQEVMRFHGRGTLKALHTLAANFTVCDQWFAPVPGPTWPNRLFAMSGTSLGRVTMPAGLFNWNLHWYNQFTIFDRLNEKGKSWKVYFGDFPLSFLLVHQWEPSNVAKHCHMTDFFRDAAGDKDQFPSLAFIEPAYMPPGAQDDHPPHDIFAGEELIASVYNAIRANGPLWNETLLIVLCDEHGGFYDHVYPPAAVAPDFHREDGFAFNQYGVRVPAILVSPWVGNRALKTLFDHTSILKFMIDKWGLGPLGNRTAMANTFSAADFLPNVRIDTPASIEVEQIVPAGEPPIVNTLGPNQHAIVALSQALESMVEDTAETVAARAKHILSNAQSNIDIAVDRVESFIEKMTAKL